MPARPGFRAHWLRLRRLSRQACPCACRPMGLVLLGTTLVGSGAILWQAHQLNRELRARLGEALLADLQSSADSLRSLAADWATRPSSAALLQGQPPPHQGAGVHPDALNRVSALALLDRRGQLVAAAGPGVQSLAPAAAQALLAQAPAASADRPQLRLTHWQGRTGLLASHPVPPQDGSRAPLGQLLVLRPISQGLGQVGRTLGVSLLCCQGTATSPRAQAGHQPLTLPPQLGGQTLLVHWHRPVEIWQEAWRNVLQLLGAQGLLVAGVAVSTLQANRRLRWSELTSRRQALRLQQALQLQAQRDDLTGLPRVPALLAALAGQRQPGGAQVLLVIDLDRFSMLNNALGRAMGDRVLQAVAQQIQQALPPSALLSRYDGAQFALALTGPSREAVTAELQALAAQLGDLSVQLDGAPLSLSASLGARWLEPEADPDLAISQASFACDMAKLACRRDLMVFGDDQTGQQRYQDLQQQHQTLTRALHNDHIVLVGQASRQLDSGRVTYIELLARLRDPEGSHLYWSEAYLEAAEFWGTLARLDRHILELACRTIRGVLQGPQAAQLPAELVFAVNLTERSLLGGEFCQQLRHTLAATGVPPQRLCLEITEQVAMQNLGAARRVLEELRAMGVRLALDDFGAGMTSLSQLRELPLDYVKIDKTFIAGLAAAETNRAVVRFVVDLSRQLGFRTIAEGVEDAATARQLQQLGVSILQGYLISRPTPVSQPWPLLDGLAAPQGQAIMPG